MTIREIQEPGDCYEHDRGQVGPRLAALLDRAEQRIEARMAGLRASRRSIRAYRADNAAFLAGAGGPDFAAGDPRRSASA